MAIANYSTTPDSNTSISGINIAEGCAPSGINDAIRQMMADIATEYAATAFQKDIWCGTAGGSKNALTLTPTPAVTAYAAGQTFTFKSGATQSDDAVTVAISGLTTKAIQSNGSALSATVYIEANKWYACIYDGAAFQLRKLSLDSVSAISATTATTAGNVSGTVAVANGGTGLTTLTANNVILGNGTSTPSFVAPTVSGNVLTANGTTWESATPSTTLVAPTFGSFTCPGSTGSYAVTGVGFQPSYIKLTYSNMPNSSSTTYIVGFGFATSTSNRKTFSFAQNGKGSGFLTNEIIQAIDSVGTTVVQADITAIGSDGFTLNFTQVNTGYTIIWEAYR